MRDRTMQERGPWSRPGVDGTRSQSNVIAVVLLAGIVAMGATAVVLAGSIAVDQSQGESSFSVAEQTMQSLDSEIEQVASSGSTGSLDIPAFENGDVSIDESAGEITVTLNKGGASHSVSKQLGTIEYEQEGQTLGYQSGGIFSKTGTEGTTAISPPAVEFRTSSSAPTLSIPVIAVRGGSVDSEVEIERSTVDDLVSELDGNPSTDKGPPGHTDSAEEDTKPLPLGATVTITVTSDYYRAWGEVFEQRVGMSVSYPGGDRVSLTMRTPPKPVSGKVNGAIISGRGVTQYFDKGPKVDSYKGHYSPPASQNYDRQNGHVYVEKIPFLNSPDIYGDLRVENLPKYIQGDVDVYGDTYLGSYKNKKATKARIQTSGGDMPKFHGDFYVKDWLVLTDVQIDGDYITSSRLTSKGWGTTTIEGSVYAWGRQGSNDAKLDEITIKGDLYLIGDIQVGKDVYVHGKVRATGKIKKPKEIKNENGNQHQDVKQYVSKSSIVGEMKKPKGPNVPELSSVSSEINDKETAYQGSNNNDNDKPSADIDTSSNELTCETGDSSCTLTAGNYYLDSMIVKGGDKLTLDTTGGDINVFVKNKVEFVGSSTQVEIVGDGRVSIYVDSKDSSDTDFKVTGGAEVVNPDDNSKQLWVYLHPDASGEIKHDTAGDPSVFKGVVYGPGKGTSPGNPGAQLTVEGVADVFGAVVGDVEKVTHAGGSGPVYNPDIHFDESLTTTRVFKKSLSSGNPRILYLLTSSETVSVS